MSSRSTRFGAAPMRLSGPTRLRRIGSVSTRVPPNSISAVAWPSHVTASGASPAALNGRRARLCTPSEQRSLLLFELAVGQDALVAQFG